MIYHRKGEVRYQIAGLWSDSTQSNPTKQRELVDVNEIICEILMLLDASMSVTLSTLSALWLMSDNQNSRASTIRIPDSRQPSLVRIPVLNGSATHHPTSIGPVRQP
jgi:hypothetical protein